MVTTTDNFNLYFLKRSLARVKNQCSQFTSRVSQMLTSV